MSRLGRFLTGFGGGLQQAMPGIRQMLQQKAARDQAEKDRILGMQRALIRAGEDPGNMSPEQLEAAVGNIELSQLANKLGVRPTMFSPVPEAFAPPLAGMEPPEAERAGARAATGQLPPDLSLAAQASKEREQDIYNTIEFRPNLKDILARATKRDLEQEKYERELAWYKAFQNDPARKEMRKFYYDAIGEYPELAAHGNYTVDDILNNPDLFRAFAGEKHQKDEAVRIRDEKKEVEEKRTEASQGFLEGAVKLIEELKKDATGARATWNRSKRKEELDKAIEYGTSMDGENGVIERLYKNLAEWGKLSPGARVLYAPGPYMGDWTGTFARFSHVPRSDEGEKAQQLRNELDQLMALLTAEERHELFGATFTGNEKGASTDLFPTSDMSLETIRSRLDNLVPKVRTALLVNQNALADVEKGFEPGGSIEGVLRAHRTLLTPSDYRELEAYVRSMGADNPLINGLPSP